MLSGKHANTTIPKFTGAVKRYSVLTENEEYYDKLTQEEKDNLDMYLTAAENFWDIVVNDHTYITEETARASISTMRVNCAMTRQKDLMTER